MLEFGFVSDELFRSEKTWISWISISGFLNKRIKKRNQVEMKYLK
jgi:hypothetical protein